jgi:hypothetical protein
LRLHPLPPPRLRTSRTPPISRKSPELRRG